MIWGEKYPRVQMDAKIIWVANEASYGSNLGQDLTSYGFIPVWFLGHFTYLFNDDVPSCPSPGGE